MFGKGGSVKEILMYNSQHTAKLVPLSLFKNCISGSQLSQWFAERNSVFFIRQNESSGQENSNFTEVNINVSSTVPLQ